jgi:glyoxylase-like metal-dependent hydrolase (beta-lactamase superfamily II)
MRQLSENLFLFQDTSYVNVVRTGDTAVLVDFGGGGVLDELAGIGVKRVTDILITHHHRDQLQGYPRAVAAGIRIWVPHTEQELIAEADAQWQAREIYNN